MKKYTSVIYLKGGRAIEEASRLFPEAGKQIAGGPDLYLLSMLRMVQGSALRLMSLGPATARADIRGRRVWEFGVRPPRGTPRRGLHQLHACWTFAMEAWRRRPDLVVCGVDGVFAGIAYVLARATGAKFILVAHCSLSLPALSRTARWTHRWLCRAVDVVVAHGPLLHAEAVALGAPAGRLLEYNVGLEGGRVALAALQRQDEGTVRQRMFVYVGRIEAEKGVFDLLDVFERLGARAEVTLCFVGEGGALQALKAQVQERGLAGRVRLTGGLSHAEVYRLLQCALVVVTPTRTSFPEGLCKAVTEAFFAGSCVIAPSFGPFPLLVSHGDNGLLYKPDCVDALAGAMGRLLDEPALAERLHEGARRSAWSFAEPAMTFEDAMQEAIRRLSSPADGAGR